MAEMAEMADKSAISLPFLSFLATPSASKASFQRFCQFCSEIALVGRCAASSPFLTFLAQPLGQQGVFSAVLPVLAENRPRRPLRGLLGHFSQNPRAGGRLFAVLPVFGQKLPSSGRFAALLGHSGRCGTNPGPARRLLAVLPVFAENALVGRFRGLLGLFGISRLRFQGPEMSGSDCRIGAPEPQQQQSCCCGGGSPDPCTSFDIRGGFAAPSYRRAIIREEPAAKPRADAGARVW